MKTGGIYDMRLTIYGGPGQRKGHASKCLLRRRTRSQRDIVHRPSAPKSFQRCGWLVAQRLDAGARPAPPGAGGLPNFQWFPMISNDFQSIPITFEKIYVCVRSGPGEGPAAADFSMFNAQSTI